MKYIVECAKITKVLFVVDAEDDSQADKKLLAGEYEKKVEIANNRDDYLGYQYNGCEKYSGTGNETVICSIEDLCDYLDTTPDRIKRDMYKNTNCGMPIYWDENGVALVGYVEGADCDGPSATLLFPFVAKEFQKTVQYLEDEAEEMWHMWNDEEEDDEE